MGWLERVPMVRGEGSLFFATRTGVRVLGLPLIACTTPAPTWWSHHIACAWTAAWLKVRGRDFLGPRELISSTDWAHPLHWQDRSGVKRSGHRPDLVAFAVSGNPVAIEVELAAKSRSRLAAILGVHRRWSYSNNSRGVVYICGDEAAHSRIERAGKRAGLYLGDGFLRIELLLRTTTCVGPTATVGKPANVATGDSVIVVPADVGMEQLTDCIASRRRYPDYGCPQGCSRRFLGAVG